MYDNHDYENGHPFNHSNLFSSCRLQENLGVNNGYHGCLKNVLINGERYDLSFTWKHVERRKNIKNCVDNPCKKHPCKNGGKCQFLGEGYKCLCPNGFVGKHCQAEGNKTWIFIHCF